VDGATYTLSFIAGVPGPSNPAYYGIVASGTSPETSSLIVNLYGSSMPLDGSVFTVNPASTSAGNTNPILGLGSKTYTAATGSVTANIVGGKVRITFTNMVFKDIADVNNTKTVSGSVTVQ
jgi:hypothetical protein